MEDCYSFFAADKFSSDLGIKIEEAGEGNALMSLVLSEKHLNAHGTVHGGVIYALADVAFGVAANSHGVASVAINTSITYMKSVNSGILYARAEEFSKNHKLGSYVVEVYNQDSEQIALFQGLAYRKSTQKNK